VKNVSTNKSSSIAGIVEKIKFYSTLLIPEGGTSSNFRFNPPRKKSGPEAISLRALRRDMFVRVVFSDIDQVRLRIDNMSGQKKLFSDAV
jgi:hypothetical protein